MLLEQRKRSTLEAKEAIERIQAAMQAQINEERAQHKSDMRNLESIHMQELQKLQQEHFQQIEALNPIQKVQEILGQLEKQVSNDTATAALPFASFEELSKFVSESIETEFNHKKAVLEQRNSIASGRGSTNIYF